MIREEIEALLSRVEKATGQDRGIDFDLVRALCPGATVGHYLADDDGDAVFHAQTLGISDRHSCPLYTDSIDAALGLVERRDKPWKEVLKRAIDRANSLKELPICAIQELLLLEVNDAQ